MTQERRLQTIDVYKRVTRIVWSRLSPAFGIKTINAIAKNSLARQVKNHPLLNLVSVDESGLEWTRVESEVVRYPEAEVSESLEAFLDQFFDALSELIGRLVVSEVLEEAEKARKEKGQ